MQCGDFRPGKLQVKNFVDYCQQFHGDEGYAYAQLNKRWQVGLSFVQRLSCK